MQRSHKVKSDTSNKSLNKFKCNLCGKTLNNSIGLKRHQSGVHGLSSLSKIKCDVCDKCFPFKERLLNHKASVHGIGKVKYPYKCDICDQMFDKVGRLKNHKSKDHSIKCEKCEKRFVSKFHLLWL